jgi:hypothetical protein
MSSVFDYSLYLPSAALVFVFALAVVAKFQPYKHKRNNAVDIILLLMMISAFVSSAMQYSEPSVYPKWLNDIIVGISASIILGYLVFLILACILPKAIQCCKTCKTFLMSKIKMIEVNEGDRPLLNHESTDYSSYS